jgi:hypothetical protein
MAECKLSPVLVIVTNYIGRCKSNYHVITTRTALPSQIEVKIILEGDVCLPVTCARCSTRQVLPHPTGPCNRTGFPEATARAKLRRWLTVDSTGIKLHVVTYS